MHACSFDLGYQKQEMLFSSSHLSISNADNNTPDSLREFLLENTNIKIKTHRKFETRLSPWTLEAVNLPSSFPWWGPVGVILWMRLSVCIWYKSIFKWNLGLMPYFTAGWKESMMVPTCFLPQEWHLLLFK